MPTVNHVGISRRISTYEERMRLKRIIYAHKPPSGGFICRTICAGVDEDKLVEDIKSLIQTWQNVYEKQQSSRPPTRLHTDLGMVLRTVRDNLSVDVDRLVIDSQEDYKQVISYVDRLMPELRSKIELYDKEIRPMDIKTTPALC
jgi:ribonuclease G